jgi:hypothetical protein
MSCLRLQDEGKIIMIKTIMNQQTHLGRLVATEREWVAANGHKVFVRTRQNITSRGSYFGNTMHYAYVDYVCECGNTATKNGSPKKAELLNHDSWLTPEQVAHITKMIEAD